jgi:hypothetical protein
VGDSTTATFGRGAEHFVGYAVQSPATPVRHHPQPVAFRALCTPHLPAGVRQVHRAAAVTPGQSCIGTVCPPISAAVISATVTSAHMSP